MNNQPSVEVAKKLSCLAQDIVLRKPPFEHLEWPEEVCNHSVTKFHLYRSEIPDRIKHGFLEYIEKWSDELFLFEFRLAERRAFADRYPEIISILKLFDEWLGKKEGKKATPLIYGGLGLSPPFDVNQIIKETFLARYPDAKLARKKPASGVRTFCKPLRSNKLFFGFERTNLRTFMSFYVGLENPWFMVDIGSFFLTGQSRFDYVKSHEYTAEVHGEMRRIIKEEEPRPENVIGVTNRALNLMEFLVPQILGRLDITYEA